MEFADLPICHDICYAVLVYMHWVESSVLAKEYGDLLLSSWSLFAPWNHVWINQVNCFIFSLVTRGGNHIISLDLVLMELLLPLAVNDTNSLLSLYIVYVLYFGFCNR